MTNEELKKEYFQFHYDNRDTIVPADISDWWLKKLSLALKEQREKIMEKINKEIKSLRFNNFKGRVDYELGLMKAQNITKSLSE